MATVQSPPITDSTGQNILEKLLDIKKNLHLPIGSGLVIGNDHKIDVIPHIYSGTEYPDKDLGVTGDIYVRYKWISGGGGVEPDPHYAADIYSIFTKMPETSIIEDQPNYNFWKEAFTDLVISSGLVEPLDEAGTDGDIYLLYEEYIDPETGNTHLTITRFYQKIDGVWAYFSGGVERSEYEQGVYQARTKSLIIYNKKAMTFQSTTANEYSRFLVDERDFVQENRSPLDFDFEFLVNVTCDPYTETFSSLIIAGDTKIKIIYVFDNKEFSHYPEQVVVDGPNIISVHYPVPVVDKQIHNLKIYMEVMNGTVELPVRAFMGNVSGTGIDAEGFSGVMVGYDDIPYLRFNNGTLFAGYEDEVNEVGQIIPDVINNRSPYDPISALTFSSMFAGLSDSLTDIDLEIPEEEEEND